MTEPYRIRSADVWAQARDDYLAGLDAEAVCRRHDLGLSAFRRRARKYGWRRVDQDDPAPAEADLSIYGDINLDDQVETARLRCLQALSRGKATEAMRWRRLWKQLYADRDAFNADFFADMTPAEMRAQLAAFRQERDREDAACLAPQLQNPSLSLSPNPIPKMCTMCTRFFRVHILFKARPRSAAPNAAAECLRQTGRVAVTGRMARLSLGPSL